MSVNRWDGRGPIPFRDLIMIPSERRDSTATSIDRLSADSTRMYPNILRISMFTGAQIDTVG